MKTILRKSVKLTLSKETLRHLDPKQLAAAQGAGVTWTCVESVCDFCTN
jgi:hypothetical protein